MPNSFLEDEPEDQLQILPAHLIRMLFFYPVRRDKLDENRYNH